MVNSPSVLGEELLVIQKEYAGFAYTNERLDLLALDKDGQIVVIENKTDDSGRDLVWQSLKYAAYCSTFSKSDIIKIYQEYLNVHCKGEDAESGIAEFLGDFDFEENELNQDDDPRIIMVARDFRPEIIATALWLLSKGLRLKCVKISLHEYNDQDIFASFDQIIPLPEARDYLERVSGKKARAHQPSKGYAETKILRYDFWTDALEIFRQRKITLYQNISPSSDHWLNAGSGVSVCAYSLIFAKKSLRTDIWISSADAARNKRVFDYLFAHKEQIERDFGAGLDWKRLDDRKSSRIEFSRDFDSYDRKNWDAAITWMADHIVCLEHCLRPHLEAVRKISGR